MNATIAACAVALSIGFFGGLKWNEDKVAEVKLEQANEKLDSHKKDVAVNAVHADNVRVAQGKAAARSSATVVVVDRNRAELERLRNELAAASEAAAQNLNACAANVATVTELFGACASELVEVAAEADKWVTHATLMQDTISSAELLFGANEEALPSW